MFVLLSLAEPIRYYRQLSYTTFFNYCAPNSLSTPADLFVAQWLKITALIAKIHTFQYQSLTSAVQLKQFGEKRNLQKWNLIYGPRYNQLQF